MSTRVLRWQVQHWRLYAGVIAGGIFGYILFGAMFYQALAAIGFMAFAVFAVVTVCAVRKAALAAKRPDYSTIARMEREVWGETFSHEGAPSRKTGSQDETEARIREMQRAGYRPAEIAAHLELTQHAVRDLAARKCVGCGSLKTVARGRCEDCYREWKYQCGL